MKHSITGVITTYRRKTEFINIAIQSMLEQTYKLSKIIVVDDNENDDEYSVEVSNLCKNISEVTYIKQNGNRGACAARNLAIMNTDTEFIAFLDDDDYWLPHKIEKQIMAYDAYKDKFNIGLVYCCGYNCDKSSNEMTDYYNVRMFIQNPTFKDMLYNDYVGSTSHPLVLREAFIESGLFWEEQPARQDYEMWIRISRKYDIVGIPDKLFVHLLHNDGQISKDMRKGYSGFQNIMRKYKSYYIDDKKAYASILIRTVHCRKYNDLLSIIYYIKARILLIQIGVKRADLF